MQEIRFHGRGGQGAVTAVELVAQAAISTEVCQRTSLTVLIVPSQKALHIPLLEKILRQWRNN